MEFKIRPANLQEREPILELIAASARGLSKQHYNKQQIEAAIAVVFGVDTDLIVDGTYFVAEFSNRLVGCGGWSRRKTLFGGDQFAERDSEFLDPAVDAAKIRAFFVHPDFARKGIGTAILETCERAAMDFGFHRFELMATLPGVDLYKARGYVEEEPFDLQLDENTTLPLIRMTKEVVI